MSETFTGSPAGTTYGSLAAALVYLDGQYGDAYTAWLALVTATQKRTLIAATRYLNALIWIEDYTTFAERDAYDLGTGDGDAAFPFRAATYELAVLAAVDPDVLTVDDQGSNIQAVGAGGAYVNFFKGTSASDGSAYPLPPILMALIGGYLWWSIGTVAAVGGGGETGSCVNPFGPYRDFDKTGPY